MSFPRYAEYKPSGVEWLGEVPAHWDVTRTKHVCQFTVGWTPPTGDNDSYIGDNLWANISDLGPKLLHDTAKRISDDAVQSSRIAVSPAGSLLFSFKLSIGQVSIAGADLYTNEAIATFTSSERMDVAFAYYAFPLFLVMNATENIYGAKLLNQELLRSAVLLVPQLKEQTAIAAFLDRETAKIDALVAEQQKLIALLKEKRQAVISHAVTKGLNPDAPMKPSGIEWLGDVPAHWEVRSLKTLSEFTTSGPRDWSERISDEGSLFIQSGDLDDALRVDFHNAKRVSVGHDAESQRTRLRSGDVVVCITGAKTGNVAVCIGVPEDAYVNQHLCLIRLGAAVLPVFIGASLKSRIGQVQFELLQYGLKQGLSLKNVRELLIPVPPVNEQHAIVTHLDGDERNASSLEGEAALGIALLKERRAALISAAVTGQIDVRGLATEEPA